VGGFTTAAQVAKQHVVPLLRGALVQRLPWPLTRKLPGLPNLVSHSQPAIPLPGKIFDRSWEHAAGKSSILGTGALRFLPEGNIHARNVTLTVLFRGDDNHHIWRWFRVALEVPLKSAYVNGIRKISELRRGQVVRLAGSGAAVVEEIWSVGECYFGRFRCQDGLLVLLTEAEEAMIGTLTRLRVVQPT
jgi:hypothetical protein